MDLGNLMSGAGILLGSGLAGVGAFRMFLSYAHAAERIPVALERTAYASELMANVSKSSAEMATNLLNLREGQEQMRITMSVLASRQDEMRDDMREFKSEVMPLLHSRMGQL